MLGRGAPYFSLYLKKLGFSAVEIGTLLALMPLARVFAPTAWAWVSPITRGRGGPWCE